jgi:hypothetical protein
MVKVEAIRMYPQNIFETFRPKMEIYIIDPRRGRDPEGGVRGVLEGADQGPEIHLREVFRHLQELVRAQLAAGDHFAMILSK